MIKETYIKQEILPRHSRKYITQGHYVSLLSWQHLPKPRKREKEKKIEDSPLCIIINFPQRYASIHSPRVRESEREGKINSAFFFTSSLASSPSQPHPSASLPASRHLQPPTGLHERPSTDFLIPSAWAPPKPQRFYSSGPRSPNGATLLSTHS